MFLVEAHEEVNAGERSAVEKWRMRIYLLLFASKRKTKVKGNTSVGQKQAKQQRSKGKQTAKKE